MGLPEYVDYAQASYARNWSEGDAEPLEDGGHYSWMAGFLAGHEKVLEIGCGDGRSTAALLSLGHSVIALEENPTCLFAATNYLGLSGRQRRTIDRSSFVTDGRRYRTIYSSIPDISWPVAGSAILLESNAITDPYLEAFLTALAPIDAVVCWLIGTHGAVELNADLPIEPFEDYRLRVQNRLYTWADKYLAEAGILHIVDRVHPDKLSFADDLRRNHCLQAEPTSLIVGMPEFRYYERPKVANQVSMTKDGKKSSDATSFQLMSITSRRPSAS